MLLPYSIDVKENYFLRGNVNYEEPGFVSPLEM